MLLKLKSCWPGDLCMRLTLKTMQTLRFSKCCFVFTLRQGTMLVAVVELCLTSIILFLMLLAAMNTQEIASMASAELQALENTLTSEFGNKLGLPFYYTNNEEKMFTGQRRAMVVLAFTYVGVMLCVMHMLACLTLLYGAMYDIAFFLVPWLSTVLLCIVSPLLAFMTLVFFFQSKCIISLYVAVILVFGLEIYAWLIVFSYYREISYKNMLRQIENIAPSSVDRDNSKHARADI